MSDPLLHHSWESQKSSPDGKRLIPCLFSLPQSHLSTLPEPLDCDGLTKVCLHRKCLPGCRWHSPRARDIETFFLYRVNPFRTYGRPLHLGGPKPTLHAPDARLALHPPSRGGGHSSSKQGHKSVQSVLGSHAYLTIKDVIQQGLEQEARHELNEEQPRAQMGEFANLLKKFQQTVLEGEDSVSDSC